MSSTHLATLLAVVVASTVVLVTVNPVAGGPAAKSHPLLHARLMGQADGRSMARERRDIHPSISQVTPSIAEEDFAFEVPSESEDDFQVDFTPASGGQVKVNKRGQVKAQRPLQRPPLDAGKWGGNLGDAIRGRGGPKQLIATVGKVFHLKLEGGIGSESYEAKRLGGGLIPSWLLLHKTQGQFWGVPLSRDIGQLNISAGGQNKPNQLYQITILPTMEDIRTEDNDNTVHKCASHEERMMLSLLLSKEVEGIKPKQRVVMISNLAKFFGLPYTAFTLAPLTHPDNLDAPNLLLAGPGHHAHRTMRPLAQLSTPVGCGRAQAQIWAHLVPLIQHQLKGQVREGTVAEVVGMPIVGWRVTFEEAEGRRSGGMVGGKGTRRRRRRQADDFGGSGDYGDYTYDDDYNYDDEYDDDYTEDNKKPAEGSPEFGAAPTSGKSTSTKRPSTAASTTTSTTRRPTTTTTTTTTERPTTPSTTSTTSTTEAPTTIPTKQLPSTPRASSETHPHRHHHGETKVTGSDSDSDDDVDVDVEAKLNEVEPKLNEVEHRPWKGGSTEDGDEERGRGVTESGRSRTGGGGSTMPVIIVDDGEEEGVVIDEAIEIPKVEDPLNAINYDEDDMEEYYDETEAESTNPTLPKNNVASTETELPTTTLSSTTIEAVPKVTTPLTTSSTTVSSSTSTTTSTTTTPVTSTTPIAVIIPLNTTTTVGSTSTASSTVIIPVSTTTESSTSTEVVTTIREHQSTMQETEPPTIVITEESTMTDVSFGTTVPIVLNGTSVATSTTEKPTTMEDTDTTLRLTTPRRITAPSHQPTTEEVFYEMKNFPPIVQNRLKRIATTAGKLFSFVIPADTFYDLEDGADGLRYEFLDAEEHVVKKDSWCQFNALKREVYGLPLEDDVSRWIFTLRAVDTSGASCSSTLEILVQQHKLRRVVNHEFTLLLHVEKKWEFERRVDWPVRVLHGLEEVYYGAAVGGAKVGGRVGGEVTVRRVGWGGVGEAVVELTWTNDTLPKAYCPREEIDQLFHMMTANSEGDPSHALTRALVPQLRVKKVTQVGLGVCEPQQPVPPVQPPQQPPLTPPTNFSPILRNPVDHINATVGELLVFKVPDDTFYDPEDVDSRTLKMSLLTVDREQIPTDHWLQFDGKNREFYGIPLVQDVGRSEYQLICEDSGGLPASDSLVVQVHAPPRQQYPVEFSATVAMDYEAFVASASLQRKFVEKIRDLFNDQNTSSIHLSSISRGSTIISWYNKTLATSPCPREEIHRLESMLVNNDRTIATRVQDIMDPEFQIAAIKLQLIGACKGRPSIQSPSGKGIPMEDLPPPPSTHEDYLVTFIVPVVIIAAMLLLAGIAACVLYRRRRTGKMAVGGVGEEDGRGAYGNKGIPVIFQEELEEKPESGTKAPIILADEKPPLAPPEYSKSGSLLKLPSATNSLNNSNSHNAHKPNNSNNAHNNSPYNNSTTAAHNATNNAAMAPAANDNTEPYQPPPPFTRPTNAGQGHGGARGHHEGHTSANGRQAGRGKATPTYRKPPPYVPP